jgi:hypothetical protein
MSWNNGWGSVLMCRYFVKNEVRWEVRALARLQITLFIYLFAFFNLSSLLPATGRLIFFLTYVDSGSQLILRYRVQDVRKPILCVMVYVLIDIESFVNIQNIHIVDFSIEGCI